jgi:predicted nuclease of predicted toxin-antitoxin system
MNILVDENIPRRTVDALRAMGHSVTDVRGTSDEGGDDELLWQRAQQEHALLVTTDKGFSQKRHEAHAGILVVRLRQPNRLKIHERVLQAMAQFTEAEWSGLVVVMRDTVQSIVRTGG